MSPKIYTEEEHKIDQNHIDRDALDIIFRLKEHGHEAYLVGGGVRDLLLEGSPKDYDISTSAKPEVIKEIFGRRCLLIGKRFRLAHLRYGNKVFEVSTFRSGDQNSSSLIVRDNVWGTAEEDVVRRDFTMNALFYDPSNRTIIDYVGGYHDIKLHHLRSIGEPTLRFKQDPVRMIRLLKFKARFGFNVDHKTERAMASCREEIIKSAPARILEEIFKMLESGKSVPFFHLMAEYGFLDILFPCFHHFFTGHSEEVAYGYLEAIDRHIAKKRPMLDRSLLFAALVFPILDEELDILSSNRQANISFGDILHLSHSLLSGINTSSFAHFPKKLLSYTHQIAVNQFRLTPKRGSPRFNTRLGTHEDVDLALQFLQLRTEVKPELKEIYNEWKKARGQG